MSSHVVYEGSAKSPLYEVQWGNREKQAWASRGAHYSSLDDAKKEAARWEMNGHDTRIVQLRKEVAQ